MITTAAITTAKTITAKTLTKTTASILHTNNPMPIDATTTAATITTASNIASKLLTWFQTHKWHAAIGAALITPAIAILQAGFFLAQYRLNFRDKPEPIVPVHGVVVVSPWDDPDDDGDDGWEKKSSSRAGAASRLSSSSTLFSRSSSSSSSSLLRPIGRKGHPGGFKRRDSYAIERIKAAASDLAPLRLLVIGDSVAAGVGVSESCAPVFPEVLAKSLSRAMGGRAVYWTCVGEAGASAAWVLRELEAQKKSTAVDDLLSEEEDMEEEVEILDDNGNVNATMKRLSSSFGGGGDGGVDEYSFIDEEDKKDYEEWCDRLAQHENTFNPDDYGQYDIAVVITGPNELKNGFLPFMVQGEDNELYRQARLKRQKRNIDGGDLNLVIDALVTKMKLRFKDSMDRVRVSMETRLDNVKDSMDRMRTSMEPMFDNMRGSMVNFRERIAQNNKGSSSSSFARDVLESVNGVDRGKKEQMTTLVTEESSLLSEYNVSDVENESIAETTYLPQQQQQEEEQSPSFGEASEPKVAIAVSEVPQRPPHPLVILPGMPMRLLPMFRWLPLRWLAYILINTLENIKRALSKAFPGTVVFAQAPGYDDIVAFDEQRGKLWEMKESTEKNVLLSLKSIPLEVCQKVEYEMKEFSTRIPVQRQCCGKRENFFRTLISSDMIHPSDLGYDFFGRHVASVILEEWNKENDI